MATGAESSDEEERELKREIKLMEREKRKEELRKRLHKFSGDVSPEGDEEGGVSRRDPKCRLVAGPSWDSQNPDEQGIVSLSVTYKNLLKNKLSELTEFVDVESLVLHLKQLDVINRKVQQRLLVNATPSEAVKQLVSYLESGPCWRLHGFLRALVLTNQRHIITLLGLNPDVYEDAPNHPPVLGCSASSAGKQHYYTLPDSEEKLQISNDLLPGLLQHCGYYNRSLMKTSLFDYDDTVPIDLTQIYIGTDPECRDNQKLRAPIKKMDMFLRLFQRHPPNTVSIEGAAGTGKSAFMQNYAYEWSKDVTACEERGLDVPCTGHGWKLILYIPLGGIRGSLKEAIEANLMCQQDLKQQMMDQIEKDGDGVLVIGDGIDEQRHKDSLDSIRDYTKDCKEPVGHKKPKVLITARDDLLFLSRVHFDRELHIIGFTSQQGVLYIGTYFDVMHGISAHPVLEYAETHEEELSWVLHNPLQVQILSELTATGFLTLEDVKSLSTVKLFRALDHHTTRRDEVIKAVDTGSFNFYRACLRCLLQNKRQITEEEAGRGSPYLSLLNKYPYRDQDYKLHHKYGFPHEMVFEFFAMRGAIEYIKSHPANKKSLLLWMCSNSNMRNTIRLACAYITQYEREMFPDTVVAIIRCCLLLQGDIKPCVKNELTEELPSLPDQIQDSFPQDLLTTGLTPEQVTKMDRMFDLLLDMFSKPADCLKEYGWAPTQAKSLFWCESGYSPLYSFILTCVEQCPPAERVTILQMTTEHLLPCATHDHEVDYSLCVVPVNGRFVHAEMLGTILIIHTWCVQDLITALNTHKQLHQLHTTHTHHEDIQERIGRLPLAQQRDTVYLTVNNIFKLYWGPAPGNTWTEAEWTPALAQLMLLLQHDMKHIQITVDDDTPLMELLSTSRKAITCAHKPTEGLRLYNGKVQEEELLQYLDWAHDVGLTVQMVYLRIVLAAGHDPLQWHHLHSAVTQKVEQLGGKVDSPTYVSASGKVLVESYHD